MKSLLRYLGLGLLLALLWGCGENPARETEVLLPSDQWQTLQTERVALDVPPGYVGGSPGLDLDALQATLVAWGKGDRTEWLSQSTEDLELLAFQEKDGTLNSINVVQGERPENLSLEAYLQQQTAQLQAAGLTVTTTQTTPWGRLELTQGNLTQISYVHPSDAVFWVITYSSDKPTAEFLAGVEQSHQSFQVRPEPS
ncbi:hypothetical protein FLX56_05655 [Synechococcus moorigangaii CMS01]|nr:hypothetical protein [Synechococcus moorigangaii CMS01]